MKINRKTHKVLPAYRQGVLLWLLLMWGFGVTLAQNIQKVEYFFDNDPGFGAAVAVPVDPPSAHLSDFSFNIDITGLDDGFHKLFVRALNQNGVWSFSNSRAFYKNTFVAPMYDLTKVEYFFDTDPGFGNGTDVPISPTTHLSNLSFSIDITSLQDGFHHLYVRTKNSNGEWSFASRKAFIKNTVNLSNPLITQVEYFIDNDPGFGQATPVPVNPNVNDVTLDFAVDLTDLPDGFHNFFIRAKDNLGKWSLTSRKSFLKKSINTGTLQITALEYFFDTDPGLGQGTSIPITPATSIEVANHIIDITNLSSGLHKLFIRAKNEQGQWSLTNIWSFYKTALEGTTPNIVAAEYFFNTDPGLGQGTPISVPGTSSNEELDLVIDITNLSLGFNKLFVRVKDATGRWSFTNTHTFYKKSFMPALPNIVYAEYFIDSDPGFGQGISIPILNPGPNLTDIVFEIDETQLIMGNHSLFVRTRDEYGRWSQTLLDVFCRTPKPNFAAAAVFFGTPTTFVDLSEFTDEFTQYFWDVDGNGTTDYTNTSGFNHLYAAPGVYNARLILISQEGCSDTIVKPVYVYACTPPSNLQATNITTNSAILSWTPANIETTWNIMYGPVGFEPDSGTLILNAPSTSYLLSGLAQETSYDFYVQSACGVDYFSAWAGPASFETLSGGPCSNPTDGGQIAASQSVCSGSYADSFTSVSPASGYVGDLQYKWQWSSNNLNFNDIPGAVYETYTHMSPITSTIWFRRLAKVTCQPDWSGAAISNVLQIDVDPSGQYRTKASGNWNNPAIWEKFDGLQWVDATDYPGENAINCPNPLVTILAGHTVTVTANVTFGSIVVNFGGTLTVQDGVTLTLPVSTSITIHGTLIMHPTALINGAGNFVLVAGCTMYVGSAQGIHVSGLLGNIQVTGTINYAAGVHYIYFGGLNQITGDGIAQYTPASITINNTGFVVTLSVAITVSGDINIIAGTFDANNYNITLGGNWYNTGTFIPGTGTVYFNCSVNVVVNASEFYNVVFGGTGTVTATGALIIYGTVTINYIFVGGSYTHYVYGSWYNYGTYVYGTSTIYFACAIDVYVSGGAFYNVVFAGTGTVTATGSITFYGYVNVVNYFYAGTYYHVVYGNWTVVGTFDPGTSTIEFQGNTNVVISDTYFYNVVFSGSGTNTASGPIVFYGNVTINSHFDAGSYTHVVYGNWTVNGTFVYGTSTIDFHGSGNALIGTSSFYNVIFCGTGTNTATGPLTFYGNVLITWHFNAGSFTHVVYGNWTVTGTFVHGTSTIDFHGSGNALIGTSNFYNVIFCGTGTNTATGPLTIYGNVLITWHFDAGSFTHLVYGNWTVTGTFVYGTSTIDFHGSGNALIGTSSFYNVIFCGTGTNIATGPLTFYGNVLITWHFNAGSFTHVVYGNWTVTGTFVHGTSTIDFHGSGNALIGTSNFYNVIFCGTGTNTATGPLTIYGNVLISWHFDAGSYTHLVYGNWTVTGTFVYGTSTIDFHGSGNALIGTSSFYNVIFCGTGTNTATGPLTIYGNVLINWHFNAGSFTHVVYGNWTVTGTFVHGTSTIDFHGSGNALIGTSNFYNVIFCGTGTNTATGSLTFYGNVLITWHFDAGSFVHYVYGNWTNNAVFIWGTSTIHFVGNITQIIGGSVDTEFYGFVVNCPGGITLQQNITIHFNLTLTMGIISAGSYTVTVVPVATIIGGSANAYISGKLICGFATTGSRFFPVGKGGLYRPVTYNCLTLSGTSMVEVELILQIIPGTLPPNISTINRYWAIAQTGGSGITFKLTCNDEDIIPCCFVSILRSDGITVTAYETEAPDFTNKNVFSAFGSFSLGVEACNDPETPVITGNTTICAGESIDLEVLSGNLNDAEEWVWYADACGQNQVGTGLLINVSPQTTTTYYVRGESACIVTGPCASVTIAVDPLPEVECPEDICARPQDTPFELGGGLPFGGIYSGTGVSMNMQGKYIFNPAVAGLGAHTITYSYTDVLTGCVNECTFTINVGSVTENLLVQDLVINASMDTCFAACKVITVSGSGKPVVIQNGGVAEFAAGLAIHIMPGTVIHPGAYAWFRIETEGNYCENSKTILAMDTFESNSSGFVSPSEPVGMNGFNMYPNPTTGRFVIEIERQDFDSKMLVEVYSLIGERITGYELAGANRSELNISEWPDGFYVVKVTMNEITHVRRLVKTGQ